MPHGYRQDTLFLSQIQPRSNHSYQALMWVAGELQFAVGLLFLIICQVAFLAPPVAGPSFRRPKDSCVQMLPRMQCHSEGTSIKQLEAYAQNRHVSIFDNRRDSKANFAISRWTIM